MAQGRGFDLVEIQELRGVDTGRSADFDDIGGLEEGLGRADRRPRGEVHNTVGGLRVTQNLVGPLARRGTDSGRVIEGQLPPVVIIYLVDDQHVLRVHQETGLRCVMQCSVPRRVS